MKRKLYLLGFMHLLLLLGKSQSNLDPSFGTNGVTTTNVLFGGSNDFAQDMAIDASGNIFVLAQVNYVGSGESDFAVMKYDPQGIPVPEFGHEGIAILNYLQDESPNMIHLLPDGSILVSGVSGGFRPTTGFLLKLLPDGSVDASFANNGLFEKEYISVNTACFGVLSNQQIILAISSEGTQLIRLNPDGQIDQNFGVNGYVSMTDFFVDQLVVRSNDEILMGGFSESAIAIVKYNQHGERQGFIRKNEFKDANGGDLSARLGNMIEDQSGNILLTGFIILNTTFPFQTDIFLLRFTEDGVQDPDFGNNGVVLFQPPGFEGSFPVVTEQSDGKILLAATLQFAAVDPNNPTEYIQYSYTITARFLPENGDPDPCYGTLGYFFHSPQSVNIATSACAFQSEGNLILVSAINSDVALNRVQTNLPITTWYLDADNDGYYTGDGIVQCSSPGEGYRDYTLVGGGDCNDSNPLIHPGRTEDCNEIDDNCDGQVDEIFTKTTYYPDNDGDGFGSGAGVEYCDPPGLGWASNKSDCDDNDPSINPGLGSTEPCNGKDDNCNGIIDEDCNGKPTIDIGDVQVYESDGVATLQIKLSHVTTLPIKINYQSYDATAISTGKRKDYKSTGNVQVSIPPGSLGTSIQIPVYSDNLNELNEYFTVQLTKPFNCVLGDASGRVTILNGSNPAAALSADMPPEQRPSRDMEPDLELLAYPNPSSSSFRVRINSSNRIPVMLQVIDVNGRIIEMKTHLDIGNPIEMGSNWQPGIYLVRILQGQLQKQQKLIKLNR